MTVKELKLELAGFDDELLVVMQKDSEGNGYSPLAGADGDNNSYKADCTYSGTVGILVLNEDAEEDGYGEEDVVGGVPCVVLYPMN